MLLEGLYIPKWSEIPLEHIQRAIYERTFIFNGDSDEAYLNQIPGENLMIRNMSSTLSHHVPFRGYAVKGNTLLMSIKYDQQSFPTRQVEHWLESYRWLFNYVMKNLESTVQLDNIIHELTVNISN
ncbi:hypothetical protein [Paenibacillus terrae]|uniref:Uncharacterized protein n=1 Tax=Paenibacillus terrae TaxID=159743 RepID=A0A0D7X0S9_9BACL|nr:hypothetical protein [Paenibacillus terrae]KJD43612.1 hypothetical protein QD47_21710 [Paenibacillus terrae]